MPSQARLDSFASLLVQARARLGLGVGFVLWNGVTVPGSLDPRALAIRITDEGVVAAVLRKPNLDTLANLWVTGRIDILNGTIFDLADERPNVRTKAFMKSLDKGAVIRTLIQFLFVPRGGPFPLERVRGHEARRDGTEHANRDNLHYHYDLSNRFYELFLDPEMTYTCAYFRDWDNDIATAQEDKLHMICRKLRLKPGERMLDIGCGWGALICHAARHYGVHATGVTLASEQADLAQEKIDRLGLRERVDVVLRDYAVVGRAVRQDLLDWDVRACGHCKPSDLFRLGEPDVEARRPVPAPHHCPAGQARRQGILEACEGICRADPLHLSRRGTRPSGHVHREPAASRIWRCTTSKTGASTTPARVGYGTTGC